MSFGGEESRGRRRRTAQVWPLDRCARSQYERCVVASASSSEYQERSREEFEHRGTLGAAELRITDGDMATTVVQVRYASRLGVVGPALVPIIDRCDQIRLRHNYFRNL